MRVLLVLGLVFAGGCTTIHGANQIGGDEGATWVFVNQSGWREPGIYRCVDTPEGPACVLAKMKK